jgi:hypothetical protein
MLTLSNLLLGMLLVSLWLLSAYIIRTCCKTMKAPQPGLMGAMMLVLLTAGGAVALQFTLGMLTGFSALGFSLDGDSASQLRLALAVPVWMLVGASVYRFMLPTTFGRAMIIFLVQAGVIAVALVGVNMLANATQFAALRQACEMLPM